MERQYYISPLRMNARISETKIDGQHISIDGMTYERISRAPAGKRKLRTLIKLDNSVKITIYT